MCLLIWSLSFSLAGLIIETVAVVFSFYNLFERWEHLRLPEKKRIKWRLLILFIIGMVLQIVGMVLQIVVVT